MLIDPKQGVDYFVFEGMAHLDGGIIDEQELASQRLAELVLEMDRRYVRFKEKRVANIIEYNAKSTERKGFRWFGWYMTSSLNGCSSTSTKRRFRPWFSGSASRHVRPAVLPRFLFG